MVAIKEEQPEPSDLGDISGIQVLSADEALAMFDHQARRLVGMSGDEFLRRWDAGEFQPVPDETPEDRRLARLVMVLPFVGRKIT